MKKILAFFLAAGILTAMGVSASASGAPGDPYKFQDSTFTEPKEIEVKGTYDTNHTDPVIYRVTVSWTSMMFACTVKDDRTWSPTTHAYIGEKTVTWDNDQAKITVVNRSSTGVAVTAVYEPKGADSLGMYFTGSAASSDRTKETADLEGGITGVAPDGDFTLKAANKPDPKLFDAGDTVDIGTVTITVTAPAA